MQLAWYEEVGLQRLEAAADVALEERLGRLWSVFELPKAVGQVVNCSLGFLEGRVLEFGRHYYCFLVVIINYNISGSIYYKRASVQSNIINIIT